MTIYEVIKRPIVTEKGVAKKEAEHTLCFEVARDANKVQVKAAVEPWHGRCSTRPRFFVEPADGDAIVR